MKVVFANSATMPTRERLILKNGGLHKVPLRVRYGLILHPVAGPTLIDTGYTQQTTQGPRSAALRLYGRLFRPQLLPEGQPAAFLNQFDLTPEDVTHVIVTHFHADHVSGLKQFPNAKFIADGLDAKTVMQNKALANVRHGIFKELVPADFWTRFVDLRAAPLSDTTPELPCGHDVFGDGQVLLTPLPGHMHHHYGVYFPTLTHPLLYATDTQWLNAAILDDRMPGPPASTITADLGAARASVARVRAYHASGGAFLLSHDPAQTPWDM